MAFSDFVEAELPLRPSVATDGLAGSTLVRSGNPLAARQMVWASFVAKYNLIGPLVAGVGTLRWYPDRDITISNVYFSLGVAGGVDAVIDVLVNGVSIFTGTFPTCLAGSNLSSSVAVSAAMLTTDYLTVNVTTGSGSNGVVVVQY